MLKRSTSGSLILLSALLCTTANAVDPATAEITVDETTPVAEVLRKNADGELINALVAEPLPITEVYEGETCGILDGNGAILTCVGATVCVSQSDDAAGICKAAIPPAPTN